MKNGFGTGNKVTQHDVAERAGVARSLVSYVINGNDKSVSEATKKKILKAIEELDYRPNKYAQGLHKGIDKVADKHFGIVMPRPDTLLRPYYAEILSGIYREAHDNGCHVKFLRFFDDLKDQVLFNELIHSEEVCGIILISLDQVIQTDEDRRIIEKVVSRTSNIVCIEWHIDGFPSVNFDRQKAAYLSTKHLLEKNCEKAAYFGPLDNRVAGFKQALSETKKFLPESGIVKQAHNMEEGYNAVAIFIEENSAWPAIVAGCDEVAIGILRYLNKNKISVPRQTAVVSIDNIEASAFSNPPLTTVNVQKQEMGRQAVKTLLSNRVKSKPDDVIILLPVNLVYRESC